MNGILKAKTTIYCDICGCTMKRTKSIKVTAEDKESAMAEAKSKVQKWQESLKGQTCKTCKSILASV